MKQFFILTVFITAAIAVKAQEPMDALRFSYNNFVGTARSQAIGNAGVSLGGDFSSTFINPAGLAQFKTNEFVFTPGFFMNRNKMSYNDSTFKGNRSALNTGSIGFVFSSSNRWRSSNIKNSTISLALTQTANYNARFSYSGRNNFSSYSEKWVEQLANNRISNFDDALSLFPDGASLAVENYLVDTILSNGNIVGYRTNAETLRMPLNQSFTYTTRGGAYEAALGFAWNNKEKLLYGLTIGVPLINYSRSSTINESDASGNTNNDFARFTYTEDFSTKGAGVNLKLGLIYKPVEHFRIGVTFHTPSLLVLTDRTNATLVADVENYARRIRNDNTRPTTYTISTRDITNGNDYNYEYQLLTPWRAAISASYVFREIKDVTKQKAFITGDVELVNYKFNSYSSGASNPSEGEKQYFKNLNSVIDELYRMAVNFKLGGELKFKTFMVRGGFNYMGSPYKKDVLPQGVKSLRRITPSLGIGYRNKGYFVDLTYAHTMARDVHFPYQLSGNQYPLAENNLTNGQILATVGFKF
ncbi:MAG: hypothetical protein K2X48_16815 [Chitinophagaceae bacterium]|nr:hypothetical protein [Chitinophagaceae bacterium]